MSYIGNTPTTQAFAPAIDYFSGNGSTTAFTLSRPVASVAQVIAIVNNVPQNPSTAFTVSSNTITFTGAPSTGTNNIYIEYTSPITQVQGLTQSPSVLGPMSVSINGAVGIGGATNPIVNMSGSANNYVQAYVNNTSNSANSSADLVAYPNNGADAAGWVDVGITSLTYSQAAFSVTGPNEAYLFGSAPAGSGTTGNLVLATDSTGTANAIQFYTGGFTKAKSAYAMQIDSSGRIFMPKIPAFSQSGGGYATPKTTGSFSAALGDLPVTVLNTTGSGFNTGTGTFTAPVAGLYEFFATACCSNTAGDIGVAIRKNSSTDLIYQLMYRSVYNGNSVQVKVLLALGDTVDAFIVWNNGASSNIYNSQFSGQMIG